MARIGGIGWVAAALAVAVAGTAQAAGPSPWQAERARQFARWQAAHPGLPARVAALEVRSAALVAARKAEVGDQYRYIRKRLLAGADSLTAARRAEAARLTNDGLALAKAGDCAGAGPTFRQALAIDRTNADANLGLGQCLAKAGDRDGAATYITNAAALNAEQTVSANQIPMMTLQQLPPPADPRLTDPAIIYRVAGAPTELWDFAQGPVMTVIPAGEFTMGSLSAGGVNARSETPHRVLIEKPVAISRGDVTRGEFAAFVAATGYTAKGCYTFQSGAFAWDPQADWRRPGIDQADDEPVVCINYFDAQAYADWLSKRTGRAYRVPTEAEWEYAVRGGTTTTDYYWGETVGLGHANCDGCTPGKPIGKPTRAGTFPPNQFGLYDTVGDVWKWLDDCWNDTYYGAPADGSAWKSGNCLLRGRRGGSWFNLSAPPTPGDPRAPYRLRSAARFGSLPNIRYASYGMRVAADVAEPVGRRGAGGR